MSAFLFDAGEDYAAFLVGVPFPEEKPCRIGCGYDHFPVVLRGLGEDDIVPAAGLGKVLLEAVGNGEDNHLGHVGMLGAKLLDGLTCKGSDLLGELLHRRHIVGEAARNTDSLFGLNHVFQLHARDAPELLPGPEAWEME